VSVIALLLVAAPFVAAELPGNLLDLRLRMFARDLEYHDYERLWLHLDADYVRQQLVVMDALDAPLTPDLLDRILFNGAVMFEDWNNRITTVAGVDQVRIDTIETTSWGDLSVRFLAVLVDGREVGFSLFVHQDSYTFYGPLG
jgi:hypothetical protein